MSCIFYNCIQNSIHWVKVYNQNVYNVYLILTMIKNIIILDLYTIMTYMFALHCLIPGHDIVESSLCDKKNNILKTF